MTTTNLTRRMERLEAAVPDPHSTVRVIFTDEHEPLPATDLPAEQKVVNVRFVKPSPYLITPANEQTLCEISLS